MNGKLTWPADLDNLKAHGYIFEFDPRANCRSCSAPILWCSTPAGKKMPLSILHNAPGGPTTYQSHFADCPNADQHRKPPTSATPATAPITVVAPSETIAALERIKREVLAEYLAAASPPAESATAEQYKLNWLYKKLCEARLELETLRRKP